MKLSIVMPARDEAPHVGGTVDSLRRHLDGAGIDDFEIIVVDDGSSDGTRAVVECVAKIDPRVRVVANPEQHGYGRAVRLGLEQVQGDAVVITMADASDAPEDVEAYYRILHEDAECVFGSRFTRGARVVDYPRVKLVLNRIVNMLIRLMFGLRYNDVTNAFKGYRRYVIDGCRPLVSPHFNLTVELPLKAIVRGYSYRVIPISWHNRAAGESHLLLKEQGSRYLFSLLSVWFEWLLVRRDFCRREDDVGPRQWREVPCPPGKELE